MIIIASIVAIFSLSAGDKTAGKVSYREGDIIFQVLESAQSKAIQLATRSKYSHVGIIFRKDGRFFVLEAIQPVIMIPLEDWQKRGKNGHYVIKRLKDPELLTREHIEQMKTIGFNWIGKNYDIYFNWSDTELYCSELVWKLYERTTGLKVGALKKLRYYELDHDIVRQQLMKRYGDNIPYDEPMISPEAIFQSGLLETVFEN